ncbi:hypothetical protein EXM65_18345 [Clostridium botulinum]|uniref:Uncharacterized protein n=1 Tax=Clostridium botulinum TaxID=1491 RepID=A0A6M0ST58_CLOBO|nr:hypothetical protein [Clostridium botulinum]
MEDLVKKIKSDILVNQEARSTAVEMEPHIKEYDTVLRKIGMLGKVEDLTMVNAFNQTNRMLDEIEKNINKR